MQGESTLRIILRCITLIFINIIFIMLFEKAILIFSSLKIPFLWELPEEFIGIGSHVPEPTGPFACVRNARLGKSPSSSGLFLHIYPCTLFLRVSVLLLLFGSPARKSSHGTYQATCSAQRCYCATSLEAFVGDSNFHRLPSTLHSFNI